MKDWFEVDKEGLAKILERKGKAFAVFELVQNAWDEPGVSKVSISLQYQRYNRALLIVEDDAPEGFRDLRHAFTLFAESVKKTNPEQRGRFNLGEKLVLAISDEVIISTTCGGIRFDKDGRHTLRRRQTVGSRIECQMRLIREECGHIDQQIGRLIPPQTIAVIYNGAMLPTRPPRTQFRETLATETADETGMLRRIQRETEITIYEPLSGEHATLYEMGIPVVETNDKWHYDIGQKVPLTLDRENVPPSFLKAVRVAVFNQMHRQLLPEDTNTEWAEQAVASPDCVPEAAQSYVEKRFGSKRVAFDPSDPEANKIAVSHGYTLVTGGMMSGGAWKNAKAAAAILPAGQVTPSRRVWTGEDNPHAKEFRDWIDEADWTDGMRAIVAYAKRVAQEVLKRAIVVKFCRTRHHLGAASYGPDGVLILNKLRLGSAWFEQGITDSVVHLIIHEFGHQYSGDHLSSEYHEALCHIGATLVRLTRQGKL